MSAGADFPAAFEAAFARLQVRVEEAYARQDSWAESIAAAIRAGFEFAAEHPDLADLLTNEALAQGPDGARRHRRLVAFAARLLEPGRAERPENLGLPEVTELALAGGLADLVAERIARGRAEELPALAGEAIEFALAPYLGAEEAARVAGAE